MMMLQEQQQQMSNENSFLLDAICKACSQNPAEVKLAESKIQQIEIQPGYCINLFVTK